MVKKFSSLIIVVIFAFIAGYSLFHKGLPPTHDGEYHVIRFYEFDKTLRAGDWYPRWAQDLNNGYGVPLFNYVYPLPNYIASFLHVFGISFIDSFKINMFLALVIGAIFFYLWAKEFWGELGGIVSSIFYIFSPYHFLDIYIRGSVGELWALAFFPAFLWSITDFIKNKNRRSMVFSSVFFALTIFSHNILALIFSIFALFYISFLISREKEKVYFIKNIIFIIFIGFGLSSIFWLPALVEQQYVTGLQIYDVNNNFPMFFQLIFPSWGSGFSDGSLNNQMSFQIGIGNLIVIVFAVLFLIRSTFKKEKNVGVILFFTICFFVIFLLMLRISYPVWERIPIFKYFQFPWRFLGLEILIASFLAGGVFGKNKLLAVFMIILVFLAGIGYAKPAYYHQRDDNYYITRSNFIDGTNSPGNYFNTIWISKIPEKTQDKIDFYDKETTMLTSKFSPTDYKFNVNSKINQNVVVNTAYFPGWIAVIDGQRKKTTYDKNGRITFDLETGKHSVELKLLDTPIRTSAKILFYISLIFVLFLSCRFVRIKR